MKCHHTACIAASTTELSAKKNQTSKLLLLHHGQSPVKSGHRAANTPVCAEQDQALVVDVGSVRINPGNQQPQPDAKLAAINQQRV
jgi:hypothetical protein